MELSCLQPGALRDIHPASIARPGEPYSITAAAAAAGTPSLPGASTGEHGPEPALLSSNSHGSSSVQQAARQCQPPVLVVGIVSSSASVVSGLLSDLLELTRCAQCDGSRDSSAAGSKGSRGSRGSSTDSSTDGNGEWPLLGGLEVVLLENGGMGNDDSAGRSQGHRMQGRSYLKLLLSTAGIHPIRY